MQSGFDIGNKLKAASPGALPLSLAGNLPIEGYPQISVQLRQTSALRGCNRRIDMRLTELLVHFIHFIACQEHNADPMGIIQIPA